MFRALGLWGFRAFGPEVRRSIRGLTTSGGEGIGAGTGRAESAGRRHLVVPFSPLLFRRPLLAVPRPNRSRVAESAGRARGPWTVRLAGWKRERWAWEGEDGWALEGGDGGGAEPGSRIPGPASRVTRHGAVCQAASSGAKSWREILENRVWFTIDILDLFQQFNIFFAISACSSSNKCLVWT